MQNNLGTSNVAIVPVLLDALKESDPDNLKLVLGEVRRMIKPPPLDAVNKGSSPSKSATGPKSVIGTAATKLIKIGMLCIESGEHLDLLADVLRTLASWRYGEDSALPLLVKSLENPAREVREHAIHVVQFVDLLGPNAYYNEKVIRLLESIARKEPSLRGDVVECFLALGMDTEFLRNIMVSCIDQTEDSRLQSRIMVMCAHYNIKTSLLIESIAKIGRECTDQQVRRVAIDVLTYIFLPKEPMPSDVNLCIDALFGLGLSSTFVSHRINRMSEKKAKSTHMPFEQFADRYII